MSAKVSTGASVEGSPYAYLCSLIIQTHQENPESGNLAGDVFARITPEDYGPLLLAALGPMAPELVDEFHHYIHGREVQ